MLIGYARVSSNDQDTAAQLDALRAAGCAAVYEEKASGAKRDRPELARLMAGLQKGDTVIVWKLDRLARSLPDLLNFVRDMEGAGAGFRSLTEAIDTTTAAGRMLMQILGAFAEFERAVLSERTRSGLAAARRAGRIGGKPRALTPEQEAAVIRLVTTKTTTAREAAELHSVHPATVSRVIARHKKKSPVAVTATGLLGA